jgi:thiamine biosynthesis lipoprotein
MRRAPRDSRRWGAHAAVATLATFGTGFPAAALWGDSPAASVHGPQGLDEFAFRHDGILGTSLDLVVQAPQSADAAECHRQVLAEVERLRRLLSTYDPASEISQVCAGAPVESPEVAELLGLYQQWQQRTRGAIRANMAGIIALWKQAAREGQPPRADELAAAAEQPLALNIDALGKGYVIERAVAVARRYAPAGLLDIGGDIRAWGPVDWPVGLADPQRPAENAPLLGVFPLREAAVAASGGYARFFTIAGKRLSHIIDPRTAQPVAEVTAATVVADDCVTANALSTGASVLGMEQGSELARMLARGHVLLAVGGGVQTGGTLSGAVTTQPATRPVGAPQIGVLGGQTVEVGGATAGATGAAPDGAAIDPWKDFLVTIDITLRNVRGPRPYVAVWVTDAQGRTVRTITLWGNDPRWLRDMTSWWRATNGNMQIIRAVARASRGPGKYTVEWDGLDDQKKPVPPGEYRIFVETARERGQHITQSATIKCAGEKQTATLPASANTDAGTVTYGPKGQ